MSQHQHSPLPESEGLQVDTHAERAAKAPEVAGYDQNGHYYAPPIYNQQQPNGVRLPFGLGVLAFTALVVLCTAIVVGAGVGGGLGAAMANKSSDCSTESVPAPSATAEATSCPTPDNTTSSDNDTAPYVPRSPSSVQELELKCPSKKNDETRYKSSKGYEFQWWCGVNAAQGSPAEGGGIVADLAPIIAYTIEDCMEACSAMIQKDEDVGTGVRCSSIVFSKKMSVELENQGANCWLKNASKASGGNWGFKDDFYAYAELDD
ncbi:Ff.00g022200.m01.CDS01 [Fusarium sp. VM40]|nr:Ff.00g022200.m01.CDS01 [Fusarium sp. VM40]